MPEPSAPPAGLDALRDLEPARVCLIKPSALGDVVHALPVLAALRGRWPRAALTWVINRGLRGLVDGHPDLDAVIPFDRGAIRPTLGGLATIARTVADLRRPRFDLAIDLQGLLRSALMARATGAKVRVGRDDAREGAGRFYTHSIPTGGPEAHAVDRLLAVAAAFGADVRTPRFQVATSRDDRHWARGLVTHLPHPRLLLNIGARWLTKRWPPEHFAAVARLAVEHAGAGLVLVGAPEDRPLVDALRAALGPDLADRAVDVCGQTSLPQLAALAEGVDLVLSNDTGPLHLAAATGTPVVGVYTCTSPGRTGPYGPNAVAVQSCVWCAPSFIRTCPRLDCMTELTPAQVWAVVRPRLVLSDARPARIGA